MGADLHGAGHVLAVQLGVDGIPGLLASAALLEGLAGIERFSAAEVDGLLRALSHSNDLIAEIAPCGRVGFREAYMPA